MQIWWVWDLYASPCACLFLTSPSGQHGMEGVCEQLQAPSPFSSCPAQVRSSLSPTLLPYSPLGDCMRELPPSSTHTLCCRQGQTEHPHSSVKTIRCPFCGWPVSTELAFPPTFAAVSLDAAENMVICRCQSISLHN